MKKAAKINNTQLLFPKLDTFFDKRLLTILYISLFFLVLFGILLFDLRISTGGDDSGYLEEANKFAEGKSFPSWHGILYVMLLGWVTKLTGFSLVLCKVLSLIFLILHQWFLYKAFKGKISSFVLSFVLIFASISSGIIYYGSQTYSEAFFLFIQSLFIYIIVWLIPKISNSVSSVYLQWGKYLTIGSVAFLLSLAKNIGIVGIVSMVIYLIINKRWWNAIYTFVSFLILKLVFTTYKMIFWGFSFSSKSGQFSEVLLKDPYNINKGSEDFVGMIVRFFENAKVYLSRIFMQELGLTEYSDMQTNVVVTIMISAFIVLALFFAYKKKDKPMQFIVLYLGAGLGGTFFALQQSWAQTRMVLPYFPMLIICFAYGIGYLSKTKKLGFLRVLFIGLIVVVLARTFFATIEKAKSHQKVLTEHLKGNKYYGYTPDWSNFLKMSEWSAKQVGEEVLIASRKPSMSYIYGGGREFHPVYRIPFDITDSIMTTVQASDKVPYFIIENDLRTKNVPQLKYALKPNMEAAISADNVLYSIYMIDSSNVTAINDLLMQHNVNYTAGSQSFRKSILDKAKSTTGIIPDNLLEKFYKGNVHYVIMANLRVNPAQKTDRTINTIRRYLVYIEMKYPGIFKQVHQIGAANAEPAFLFKIDYESYDIAKKFE